MLGDRLLGDRLFGLGYHRSLYFVGLCGRRGRQRLAICRLFDLSTRVQDGLGQARRRPLAIRRLGLGRCVYDRLI